jgi:hypothetical protein
MKLNQIKWGLFSVASTLLLFSSCNDTPKVEVEPEIELPTGPQVGVYDGALFSIPSPIQLSNILKSSGASYDAKMLNSPSNVNKYTSVTQQALNLGIYGADLGYSTLYDNQQEALNFMRSAKKLSDVLGISDAFDNETLDLIERNLNNKDSLLYIVSNTYRKADDYLQSANRKHIGALIIVGGWIESLYFATQLGVKQKNPLITKMVGQQKHTINTLLEKMLVNYLNEDGVEELFNELEDLLEIYDEVEITYVYNESEHNKKEKVSTINSASEVKISDETFIVIAKKVEAIRKKIIL